MAGGMFVNRLRGCKALKEEKAVTEAGDGPVDVAGSPAAEAADLEVREQAGHESRRADRARPGERDGEASAAPLNTVQTSRLLLKRNDDTSMEPRA